jgi:hypothetical protein
VFSSNFSVTPQQTIKAPAVHGWIAENDVLASSPGNVVGKTLASVDASSGLAADEQFGPAAPVRAWALQEPFDKQSDAAPTWQPFDLSAPWEMGFTICGLTSIFPT